jgi:protein-tyrosine kinase
MEKIAIAVERAARDGRAHVGSPLSAQSAGAASVATGAGPPRRIAYSRTPSVTIPSHVLERHRLASVKQDVEGDSFRLLRTQILLQMRQHGWQTLALTSPNKGAGKSTIALNLAMSFAMEVDYTALLVDADLRDPDIRKMLELESGPGLADYLAGRAPVEDLLIHLDIGNLVVLPGGDPVARTSELMRSPMMVELIRELRARYRDRLIVFDVPPVLAGADTLAFAEHMDATVLIVEECRTRKEDFERACDLLRGSSNLIGIVLNKSRELPEPEPITRPAPGFLERVFGSAR